MHVRPPLGYEPEGATGTAGFFSQTLLPISAPLRILARSPKQAFDLLQTIQKLISFHTNRAS